VRSGPSEDNAAAYRELVDVLAYDLSDEDLKKIVRYDFGLPYLSSADGAPALRNGYARRDGRFSAPILF